MPKEGEIDSTYPERLLNQNKIKLLEEFKGAKKHHQMQCIICNHQWVATPASKIQTYKKYSVSGCPICNNSRRENIYKEFRNLNLQKLKKRGIEILTPNFDGRRHLTNEYTYEKILVRNTNCGHDFLCSPSNLISRNVECAICGPLKRVEPLTRWSKQNSEKWKETATDWQKYKSMVSKLTAKTFQKYKNLINPNKLIRGKAGEVGVYHLDHIIPKRFCFENKIPPEICAHKDNLQMIGWRENVGARDRIKGTIPPLFFNYIETNSKLAQHAKDLQSIFPKGKLFHSINGIVTTLFDEEKNHAIVVIPLDKTQANIKSALTSLKSLQAANVSYTILFEDEIINKQLLQSKLQHYTKNNLGVKKLHARQCKIREIVPKQKQQFLEKYHIQGNDNAQILYGAFSNIDELVAVMTFTSPRVAMGHKKNKEQYRSMWELSRFATNINFRIPGIASKLLAYFQKNNEWTEIYSYADRRWSTGNLYEKIGFTLVATNPPDYFYVVDGKRKHRWNYRKDILKTALSNYNPQLTEYQNMQNNGYYRVWGCGTLKYSIKKPTT